MDRYSRMLLMSSGGMWSKEVIAIRDERYAVRGQSDGIQFRRCRCPLPTAPLAFHLFLAIPVALLHRHSRNDFGTCLTWHRDGSDVIRAPKIKIKSKLYVSIRLVHIRVGSP